MNAATASEIARLEMMTITKVVERFESLFGEKCRSRNKRYLIRRIAWRLHPRGDFVPARHRKRKTTDPRKALTATFEHRRLGAAAEALEPDRLEIWDSINLEAGRRKKHRSPPNRRKPKKPCIAEFCLLLCRYRRGIFSTRMPLGNAPRKIAQEFFVRTYLEKLSESVCIASFVENVLSEFLCYCKGLLDFTTPQRGVIRRRFYDPFQSLDHSDYER
jgi:hypothetical protein